MSKSFPEQVSGPVPVKEGSRIDWKTLLRPLTSLRLTIVLLSISMVLVFVGTLAQVHLGIEAATDLYFRSLLVMWSPPGAEWSIPIMPGGYLLGFLLLINLLAAHITRFSFSGKKTGIFLIHAGIIVLLAGELLTGLLSVESQLRLDEGETKAYSESFRESELVIIETTDPEVNRVYQIPERLLTDGRTFTWEELPFSLRIERFMPNSRIFRRPSDLSSPNLIQASRGLGQTLFAQEIPRTGKIDERDISTAYLSILTEDGSLGIWMVCNAFLETQIFFIGEREFHLELRQRRFYKPFSLTLKEFTHDRYAGTDIPKNFSSRIRLVHTETNEDREVLIYMNNPLRYAGLTFYQAGFDNDDTTTVLQVVRNPARHLPYIACLMVFLGMFLQFGQHLLRFQRRQSKK